MKYRNKKYKWFQIMFEDSKPTGVILYENSPYGFHSGENGRVSTYWDNECLTEKPLIN